MEENNQNPNTPPASPAEQISATPLPTKPKLKLPILISIIVILIIVGTASAAYLILNNSNQQKACTMEAMICPDGSSVGRTGPNCEFTPCPTPNPTTDPTATWKTYTNNTYGYSVKFPPEYRAATGGIGSDATGIEASFNVDYPSTTMGAPGYPFFYVNVVKDKDVSRITYNKDGFLESISSGKEVNVGETLSPQNQSWNETFVRLPDVDINNNTFHVYEADTFGKPAADGSKDKRLVINHSGMLFVIGTYYTSHPNDKAPKLFEQILSTFKFTN